jgi:hypothetical protein
MIINERKLRAVREAAAKARAARRFFIYYARAKDGSIKIGFSECPARRIKDQRLALMAIEKRGYRWPDILGEERKRHCDFWQHRLEGEFFRPDKGLLDWIDSCSGTESLHSFNAWESIP